MKPSDKRGPHRRTQNETRRSNQKLHAGPRPEKADPRDHGLRIWGNHAVDAALANPARVILRLHLTENAEQRLSPRLAARRVEVLRTTPRDLDRMIGPNSVHQGAVADVEPLPETDIETLIEAATHGGGPIVVLDQVTDPHNVGAILRSAAVFGAAGLVMTRRHSPPLDGALAKAASGALELIPIVLVPNLARTLGELGEAGVSRIGLDGEGEHLIDEQSFAPPSALVLGAEGKGLRRLTRELCDRLCRIGAAGSLASLNVSNAAAVALYAAARKR